MLDCDAALVHCVAGCRDDGVGGSDVRGGSEVADPRPCLRDHLLETIERLSHDLQNTIDHGDVAVVAIEATLAEVRLHALEVGLDDGLGACDDRATNLRLACRDRTLHVGFCGRDVGDAEETDDLAVSPLWAVAATCVQGLEVLIREELSHRSVVEDAVVRAIVHRRDAVVTKVRHTVLHEAERKNIAAGEKAGVVAVLGAKDRRTDVAGQRIACCNSPGASARVLERDEAWKCIRGVGDVQRALVRLVGVRSGSRAFDGVRSAIHLGDGASEHVAA